MVPAILVPAIPRYSSPRYYSPRYTVLSPISEQCCSLMRGVRFSKISYDSLIRVCFAEESHITSSANLQVNFNTSVFYNNGKFHKLLTKINLPQVIRVRKASRCQNNFSGLDSYCVYNLVVGIK